MENSVTFVPKQIVSLPGAKQSPFDVRLITTKEERHAVFVLRRRAYAEYIEQDASPPDGEYRDAFDDLATTILLGAFDEGRLVGAMRLCFSGVWDCLSTLPCAEYYPALVPIKRAAAGSLMEVSRFSIDPDISNTSYRTTLYASLVRASLMAAEAADVARILIGTQPEWVRFYKYMLGFDLIGEPAIYPPGDIRIALLGGSLAQARLRQRLQNKFFRISDDEIESMRRILGPVLDGMQAA